MIRPFANLFRRQSVRSRVRKALGAGVGLYNRTWPLDPSARSAAEDAISPQGRAQILGPQVLDWCRLTMGQMRRPYGLDHVSLVVAVIGADDREMALTNFGVLRPSEFYGDGAAAQKVEHTLAGWDAEGILSLEAGDHPRKLVALLLSWGDLTRELLLAG